jgi:hypothetical protein
MNNVTHDYQISSTPHANQEHKVVEHTAELPLSQGALLVDPCDKEESCDISLFTTSLQLDGEHSLVSCSAPNILLENKIQLALSEETIPEPSPTCENKIVLRRCHLLCVLLCVTLGRIKRIWLHNQ